MIDKETAGILVESPLTDDAHNRVIVREQLDREREQHHIRNDILSRVGYVPTVFILTLVISLSATMLFGVSEHYNSFIECMLTLSVVLMLPVGIIVAYARMDYID